MQTRHVPRIDSRYWLGIIFASIFGTNLGDLYAHDSGLGLGLGLLLLVLLFAIVFWVEKKDSFAHDISYWLAIIIIRTGATNIADYLAFRVRIPGLLLSSGFAALAAGFAWRAWAVRARADAGPAGAPLAATNLNYWAAMLAAGVFGTVTGDICSHDFGQGPSSIVFSAAFAGLLFVARRRASTDLAVYWCAVGLARVAGTCIGDWFAENSMLHLGLPLSTLLTGAAFVAILAFWRDAPRDLRAAT